MGWPVCAERGLTISAVRAVIGASVVVIASGDEGKASAVCPRGTRSGAMAGAAEGSAGGAGGAGLAPSISAFISASFALAPTRLEGGGLADSARVMSARRVALSSVVIACVVGCVSHY